MDNNEFNFENENASSQSESENSQNTAFAAQEGENAGAVAADAKKTFDIKKEIREWVFAIIAALLITFLIKGFLFDIVKVDGHSMDPTLAHGQHIVLNKLGYTPKRGDIVVIDVNYKKRQSVIATLNSDLDKFRLKYGFFTQRKHNLRPYRYIKRIIGVAGDKIFIDNNGNVFVNDELIEENYIQGTTEQLTMLNNPHVVEEGCVFVMGDNREHSSDSRSINVGTIPYEAVLGKATLRIWPLNQIGMVH